MHEFPWFQFAGWIVCGVVACGAVIAVVWDFFADDDGE